MLYLTEVTISINLVIFVDKRLLCPKNVPLLEMLSLEGDQMWTEVDSPAATKCG